MGSELIVNATLPETRIALLEKGEIQELFIEREEHRGIVGNIYKGRVIRVLPGMQAAFVDIGLDKAAFLYVDDVFFPDLNAPVELPAEEGSAEPEGEQSASAVAAAAEVEEAVETDEVPVAVSPGGDALWRGADTEALAAAPAPASADSEEDEDTDVVRRRRRPENVSIQDLVKEGQDILVQVAKEPIGTKGARLTCHVSLPGRYLVFMPTVDHVGVSRRIESESERRRLKSAIYKNRPPKTGFIVRTASSTDHAPDKLREDIAFLVEAWNEVRDKYKKTRGPCLVYEDYNIVLKAIRDVITDEVDRVVVDSRSEHKNIMKFIQQFMPHMKNRIELYDKPTPIFDYYSIELEIARALERKVWLKSGGYIVIDQSEALVAIDVNTGRFVGKRNLEDTILKTNLEAVKEIAYQLRLRNCGGIIILDLIDMEKETNREKVYQALEEALKKDRARPTILKISQLGLVEMTRKRTRDSMVRTLCEPCPYCEGRSYIKNKITIAYEIMRELEREGANRDTSSIVVECHPSVADILAGDQNSVLADLEQQLEKKIVIKANDALHLEQYDVTAVRGERYVTVRERKKEARGLGKVTPLSDELSEQIREYGGEYETGLKELSVTDEAQTAEDGDRQLREERHSDRLRRGRRHPKQQRSGRHRKKPQESWRGEERSAERSESSEQKAQQEEVSQVAVTEESMETRSEVTNVSANSNTLVGAGAARAPRTYEEYIRVQPEPGTELTRAEWEGQNSGRGLRTSRSEHGGPGRHRRHHRKMRRGGRSRHHGSRYQSRATTQ